MTKSCRFGNCFTAISFVPPIGYIVGSFLIALMAPAAKAQARQLPSVLKPELQPLSFFIGRWSCHGEFVASHKPISSHVVFSSDLGGSWLAFRWDDNAPNIFHALELWGFDKTEHHFTNSIYDNFGGVRVFYSSGWIGDDLTWTRDAPSKPSPGSERFVINRKFKKEFVISWQVRKPQAEWITGDRLTCSRR